MAIAAQLANAPLSDAERAYRSLDYDQVQHFLDKARTEPTTPDEYARIVELTAIMDAIYGRPERAEEGFRKLLLLKPNYTLPPATSPKILEAFNAALAERDAEATSTIPPQQTVITSLPPDSPVLQPPPEHVTTMTPPQPIYARAWFWGAVGGALVATAAVIVLTSTHAPPHDAGPFVLR